MDKIYWKCIDSDMTSFEALESDLCWKINHITDSKKENHPSRKDCNILCMRGPAEAIYYAGIHHLPLEILTKIIVWNKKGNGKKDMVSEYWRKAKIIEIWKFSEIDLIELAIFCSESVLYLCEESYPDDDRPKKAIESTKNFLRILKSKNEKIYQDKKVFEWSLDIAKRKALLASKRAADFSFSIYGFDYDCSDVADAAENTAKAIYDFENIKWYVPLIMRDTIRACDWNKKIMEKIDNYVLNKFEGETLTI